MTSHQSFRNVSTALATFLACASSAALSKSSTGYVAVTNSSRSNRPSRYSSAYRAMSRWGREEP